MMGPGPELDAAVCAAVGIAPYEVEAPTNVFENYVLEYPPVSTDIAAAWRVLDAMKNRVALYVFPAGNRGAAWYCGPLDTDERNAFNAAKAGRCGVARAGVFAATLPEAICRAALKALRVDP